MAASIAATLEVAVKSKSLGLAAVVLLLAAACGGGDTAGTEAPQATPAPTSAATTPTTTSAVEPPATTSPPTTSPEAVVAGADCATDGIAIDADTSSVDPRAAVTGVIPVVNDNGNLWLVLCLEQGWGDQPPLELDNVFFEFAAGPTGNAARVLWQLDSGELTLEAETSSGGPFQSVLLRLRDGNIALFIGLRVPAEFEGLVVYSFGSQSAGQSAATVDGEVPISSEDVQLGEVDVLYETMGADGVPGFDLDG